MNAVEISQQRLKIIQISISVLALLVGLTGLIITIGRGGIVVVEFVEKSFICGNLIALFIALVWINKCPELKFRNGIAGKINYCRKFNIRIKKNQERLKAKNETDEIIEATDSEARKKIAGYSLSQAESNNKRVNKSAQQFCHNIFCYAIILFLVYILFLADSKDNRWHILFVIGQTTLNLFSATFLYMAFNVLTDKTVELKRKQAVSNTYWKFPVIASLLVIIGFPIFLTNDIQTSIDPNNPQETNTSVLTNASKVTITNANKIVLTNPIRTPAQNTNAGNTNTRVENENTPLELIASGKIETDNAAKIKIKDAKKSNPDLLLNIFRLVAGIWNGLAMILLFSRYISIKHTVDNIHKLTVTSKESLIFLGIIFLLPIYALAQPLFGSFEIDAFGDSKSFSNWVFGICLFGKIFFLYITYLFINQKSIHLYMHLVINKHGVPSEIREYFDLDSKIEKRGR